VTIQYDREPNYMYINVIFFVILNLYVHMCYMYTEVKIDKPRYTFLTTMI